MGVHKLPNSSKNVHFFLLFLAKPATFRKFAHIMLIMNIIYPNY